MNFDKIRDLIGNFNWRNWWRRTIPIDKAVEIIAGLGVPGLVLLVAMSLSGWAGGAAIVTALATLGGPLGMLGGITLLGGLVLIASAIPRFGFWEIFKRVLEKLKEQGKTKEEILQEIDRYPIAKELKQKLRNYIENMEGDETDEWQEVRLTELSERAQEILSIVEPLVGKDFEQFESRLNEKIDDVKEDLNNRIDGVNKDFEQLESRLNKKIDDVKESLNNRIERSETRLKWFISIAVVIGCITTSGIVALIISLLDQ